MKIRPAAGSRFTTDGPSWALDDTRGFDAAASARRACQWASALVVMAACCLAGPTAHAAGASAGDADSDAGSNAADALPDSADSAGPGARPLPSGAPHVSLSGDELAARIDTPALAPGMTGRTQWSGASYRWWLSRGRADVGLGLGTLSFVSRPVADGAAPGALASGSAPMVTLGMRYRTTDNSAVFADASNVRGLGSNRGDLYLGKVGVEWKPSPKPWSLVQGGLGMQLDGDARMSVRLRHGKLGLFVKSEF